MRRGCSVRTIYKEIDAREFGEMMAMEQIDPTGEERADLRMGILASAILNSMPFGKKRWKPSDFMPEFGKIEKPKKTVAQMQFIFETWAAAQNRGAA